MKTRTGTPAERTATATPENKSRVRMSKEARRHQLIGVALELFSNRGFDGTTTKEIAAVAGVSEGIIFHHFPTKKDLYTAILEQKSAESSAEEWLDELRGHAARRDDEAFFRAIVSKILDSYRNDPQYQRMMLDASLRGHEMARLANAKLHLPIFGFLQDYISRRQTEGAFRDFDPSLTVLSLVAMPIYYSMVTRLFGVPLVERSDGELESTFTTLFMKGLGKQ